MATGVTKARAEADLLDAHAEKELAIAAYVREETRGLRIDNKGKKASRLNSMPYDS